jgi:hypothetical protein
VLTNESQREIEKILYKLCKNTGAVILQTHLPSFIFVKKNQKIPETNPMYTKLIAIIPWGFSSKLCPKTNLLQSLKRT